MELESLTTFIAPILEALAKKYPVAVTVFASLGSLVIVAQAVVAITPGKSDDKKLEDLKKKKVVAILLNFLKNFAPIQKKAKEDIVVLQDDEESEQSEE
jgi:hypothetical protein